MLPSMAKEAATEESQVEEAVASHRALEEAEDISMVLPIQYNK